MGLNPKAPQPKTTMKNLHTPGPWNVTNLETAETVFYIGGQSGSIASAWNKGGGEGEANARLIAAAPELLEACRIAYNNLKPKYPDGHLVMLKLSEAIKQATS